MTFDTLLFNTSIYVFCMMIGKSITINSWAFNNLYEQI